MSEIFDAIVYACGYFFIGVVVIFIVFGLILEVKEITYDAHKNKVELQAIKHRYKMERKSITSEEDLERIDYIVEGRSKK